MTTDKPKSLGFNTLLAGGLIAVILALMIDVQSRQPRSSMNQPFDQCTGDMQSNISLSEQHLATILAIPERDSKDKIRSILSQPYCVLPMVEVRSGVNAEREVYPLSFADHTWLVLLFEGDEYAGYRISTHPH